MSEITKLPDGSAFFTAEIMSKEEVEKLPIENRPLCYRVSDKIYHDTFEAIGAASMCWNPKPSLEVFDSEKASQIAVDLLFKFANELECEKTKYNELLYAVARKFDGETRHETALRYINEAENKCVGECSCNEKVKE